MGIWKHIFLILFFFGFFQFNVFSQSTGCIADVLFQSNGRLYTVLISGSNYDAYADPRYSNPSSSFCIIATGNSCTVQGAFTYTGYEVTYGPLPCPIDNEWYFMVIIGIAGFLIIRNRKSHCLAGF